MRDPRGRATVLALALIALGGCSSGGIPPEMRPTSVPFAFTVDDRSSWGVLQIKIGDASVGSVSCSSTTTITPGTSGVPALPWTVRLLTANGTTIDQRVEEGLDGPRYLLVFDTEVREGDTVSLGPVPECAMPSPSIKPLPTGGIAIANAIDLAGPLASAKSSDPIVVRSATIGRLGVYTTVAGIDPETPVWAESFTGAFADRSVCVAPPSATPCPSQPDAMVLLDFTTGALLAFVVPVP